jgi:hypothetical protein
LGRIDLGAKQLGTNRLGAETTCILVGFVVPESKIFYAALIPVHVYIYIYISYLLFSRFSSQDFKISSFVCKYRLHLGLPTSVWDSLLKNGPSGVVRCSASL